jgi:hypothetical protein
MIPLGYHKKKIKEKGKQVFTFGKALGHGPWALAPTKVKLFL